MLETVNNLLQPQAQAAWRTLNTGEQLRAATMLLDTVEEGAFVMADNLLKTDVVRADIDNIRESGHLAVLSMGRGRGRGHGGGGGAMGEVCLSSVTLGNEG